MKSDCYSVAVAGEGTWDGAAEVLLTDRDSIVGHLNIVITIFYYSLCYIFALKQ